MLTRRIFSVGELTSYLASLMEQDPLLQNVWVRGEVSNLRLHSSGHLYLTLKDSTSTMRCVMFRSRAARLTFAPQNGMRVLARGYVAVFERDGQYQLYLEELQPDGVGALFIAFQQLKQRLSEEGLFEPARKRPLPWLPRKIGIVTSLQGAVLQDMLTIIRRRCPGVDIVVAPAAVQGELAPAQIAGGLARLNELPDVEVIIVGRGGGSLEELWAFNTEEVARAIFQSRVPVISAVGHETDYTIADWVADCRAPTPSAAAELVVPNITDLYARLTDLQIRLGRGIRWQLAKQRQNLISLANQASLVLQQTVKQQRQQLTHLERQLRSNMAGFLARKGAILKVLTGRLEALSPLGILSRGYSICRDYYSQTIIRASHQTAVGGRVEVILHRGGLICKVEEVKEEPWCQKNM